MKPSLCISFRFIQPYALFHGRCDGGEPEWPPSPLRAFQAILNAACLRTRGTSLPPTVRSALQELEVLRPIVIASRATLSDVGYRAYVPHNQFDLVFAALQRGVEPSTETFRKINGSVRTEKDFRPHRIEADGDELPAVHFVYPLDTSPAEPRELLQAIRPVVRSIHCLGWGIDQVIADASLVENASGQLVGECWVPTARGGNRLRVSRRGSLDALVARHDRILRRLVDNEWTPVPPMADLDQVRYRRISDAVPPPCVVFKLVDDNDDTVTYPQSKLVHIAGMVRHLAKTAMQTNPPRDLRGRTAAEWVESYVVGHRLADAKNAGSPHTQFSYVPLQSLGNPHTDPGVRRVMIVAPVGDYSWLEHLARHLDGSRLQPLPGTRLPSGTRLNRIDESRNDGVRDAYVGASSVWASVTPVILPGHDDRKPQKTRALILRALEHSGLEQACTFEWSAFSRFPKMLSAHKYRSEPSDPSRKSVVNYVRPDHLRDQTAVHLLLTFANGVKVPGPIVIGAGRHYGFGLMARVG